MNEVQLRSEIKKLIVESLRLDAVKPDDIKDEEPLFSPTEGLGLDSLSALEILTAIEYQYKVRFDPGGGSREHFRSVATLASFVKSKLPN